MPLKHFRTTALMVTAAVALAVPGNPALAEDRVKLTIAFQEAATPALAKASGAFEDLPFDLEWAVLSGPAAQISAVYADAIDIGYVGDTGLIFEAANSAADWSNGPAIVNFAAWNWDYLSPTPNIATIIRSDAEIATPADLRGKRWVYNWGGVIAAQYIASLARADLTAGDIEPIQLPDSETAVAAFKRGDADVLIGRPPLVSKEIEDGAARILWTFEDLGIPNLAVLIAKPSTLETKHEATEELLRRFAIYFNWLQNNPGDAQAVYAATLKLQPDAAAYFWETNRWNYTPVTDDLITRYQEIADGFHAQGALKKTVDTRSLWNLDFQALTVSEGQ